MYSVLPQRVGPPTVEPTRFGRTGSPVLLVPPRLASYLAQPLTGETIAVVSRRPSQFWTTGEEYNTLIASAQQMVSDVSGRDIFDEYERNRLTKFVQWRSMPVGWQVIEGGLLEDRPIIRGAEGRRLWGRMISAVWRNQLGALGWGRAQLAAAATGHLRMYADRAKGAPFHFASKLDWSEARWHIMAARGMWTGRLDPRQLALQCMESVPWMRDEWYAMSFVRLQGSAKPSNVYRLAEGGLVPDHSVAHRYPKVRTIWSVPMWINAVMRPSLGMMAAVIKASPWHAVDTTVVRRRIAEWAARGLEIWSEDASGFDQSIPGEAIRAVTDYDVELSKWLGRPEAFTRSLAATYEAVHSMGVLGPRVRQGEAARLWARDGRAVVSGLSLTTAIDTWVRLGSVVQVYAWTVGTSLDNAWDGLRSGRWGVLIYGDDAVVAVPPGTSTAAWQANMAQLGFTTKLEAGATFLMRWYGYGRSAGSFEAYGFASNMFNNSVNRETQNEAKTETIAALGIAARLEACRGSPNLGKLKAAYMRGTAPMQEAYGRAVREGLGALSDQVARELLTLPADQRRKEIEQLVQARSASGELTGLLVDVAEQTEKSTTTDITAAEYAFDELTFRALTRKLARRAREERPR